MKIKISSNAVRIATSLAVLGAVFVVAGRSTDTALIEIAKDISPSALMAIGACLLLNTMAAALRFNYIASRIGRPFQFANALAIVSASNIAGAILFQLAGQLAARGALMSRLGNSAFANAVVITLYERLSAAFVSVVGAAFGAYIVFGQLYVDMTGGGAALTKLTVGGLVAVAGGLYVSGAWRALVTVINTDALRLWIVAAGLSLLVQTPMILAYMFAAYSLAPSVPFLSLFGATLVVMFAASIPISFAGWGVRELSAVVALGAIGISSGEAFLAALIIGIGSMLVAGICAAVTLPAVLAEKPESRTVSPLKSGRADYEKILALAVPMIVAMAVPFQVHVPIASSVVNVNLADPPALVGGALFLLRMRANVVPQWRYRLLNFYGMGATGAVLIAVAVGAFRYGISDWALLNRLFGWFLVLAYAVTGALVVLTHGLSGASKVVGAFVGAMVAVCAIDIVLLAAASFVELDRSIISRYAIEGFAQNRNAFAFQVLIAMCAALAFHRKFGLLPAAVLLVALCLTWSRSGLITGVVVLGFAGAATFDLRRILLGVGVAVALPILVYALTEQRPIMYRILSAASNTAERMETISGGLRLFFEHPLFGAGVGAYRLEGHLSSTGEPMVIHSSWLWLLAETGLFGFLIFVLPMLVILRCEARQIRKDDTALAIFLCLLVMGLMGIPADMFFQRTFWLAAGLLLAVPRPKIGVGYADFAEERAAPP